MRATRGNSRISALAEAVARPAVPVEGGAARAGLSMMTAAPAVIEDPSAWVCRFAPRIRAGGSVLDVACGGGRHARYLAAQGLAVLAADIDAAALEGLAGIEGVQTLLADLEGAPWPFSGRRFDAVVVTRYLHRPLLGAMVDVLAPGGVLIYETFAAGNTVETIKFVQPTAGGPYAVASTSTSFILPGTATTALSVNAFDQLKFTIANGAVTAVAHVGATGTATTFTPDSHTTFKVLAPGYVQETVTFGTHSSYEVFYAGSGAAGISTEVAHGSGTTVDLVGLQAQMSHLPANLMALL